MCAPMCHQLSLTSSPYISLFSLFPAFLSFLVVFFVVAAFVALGLVRNYLITDRQADLIILYLWLGERDVPFDKA